MSRPDIETPFARGNDAIVLHVERDGLCVFPMPDPSAPLCHYALCEHNRFFDLDALPRLPPG